MEEIERIIRGGGGAGVASSETKAMSALARPPSLTDRLRAQRETMAAELARLDEAIAALERHPEVAATLDSISKIVGRF